MYRKVKKINELAVTIIWAIGKLIDRYSTQLDKQLLLFSTFSAWLYEAPINKKV